MSTALCILTESIDLCSHHQATGASGSSLSITPSSYSLTVIIFPRHPPTPWPLATSWCVCQFTWHHVWNVFHSPLGFIQGLVFIKISFQSCLTLCDPMDCSLPGSSIRGIFQARILEWVAISLSRGTSQSRHWTLVSRIVGRRFAVWATRETIPKP